MQSIEFDRNGCLIPYDIIEMPLQFVKHCFVDSMKEKEHRAEIFNNFIEYNKILSSIIKTDYVQWINGSFVTKKIKPNDIDLVTFIDYAIVKQYKTELEQMVFPFSFKSFNVDAYIVRIFNEVHEKYAHSLSDTLYWMHHFSKTKPDKRNRQFSKGFIKINFRYEK